MSEAFALDVLICGAGASGLALALDLARRGISFRVIEKLQQPFQGSRGKGIQPRTQEVFEDLGVIDRLFAAGGEYPAQRAYHDDGSATDSPTTENSEPTPEEPYRSALMVPQFLTEQVLRERLGELGADVEFGCERVSFAQDAYGVSVRLRRSTGEERLRVRYLVAADGGKSSIRHALDIGFPGKTLPVRAMVADVRLRGLSRDAWHRFKPADMANQVSICPLAGTDLFQIQAAIALEGDVDLSATGISSMLAERTGRADLHVDAVSWASAYQMNARLADRFRVGRVFLVGDAAHIHPPTGGQGLNTSVQDAYNLGWKLAAVLGGADPELLDSYEEERRPIAAEVLGLSTRLLDHARRGDVRRGREVHQLDQGYRTSSLALEHSGAGGRVRAGDRAPDATLRGAAGPRRRLFELLRGPHWTLIGQATDRALVPPRRGLHVHTIGERGELTDDAGDFARAYGLERGGWVLVRPDGYIGALVASQHAAALDAYLHRVGVKRATHP
jgi:2-polyprenyl-6-methoxyphenol hydroxylase-like FAD-dependent oxidoreductase